MMMRMLVAGGIPGIYDNTSSYEAECARVVAAGGQALFLNSSGGKCVKVLDPQNGTIPEVPIAWIWMHRRARDQARSQAKFLRFIGINLPIDPTRLMLSIAQDNEKVPVALSRRPRSRVLVVCFERLVEAPDAVVSEVAAFVGRPMDTAAMRACVLKRSAACAPDMSIELAYMAKEDAQLASERS